MAAAPSKQKLRRWQSLDKRRLAAQRKARDLAALQEPLEAEFFPAVQAAGGHLEAHDFRLVIAAKKCGVKWAEAFVAECGESRAAALRQAAPTKDELRIEQIAACPPATRAAP